MEKPIVTETLETLETLDPPTHPPKKKKNPYISEDRTL